MVGMHCTYLSKRMIWDLPKFYVFIFPFIHVTNDTIITFLYPSPGTHVKNSSRVYTYVELWHIQLCQKDSKVIVSK
jgi:hypothetical protein